MADSLERTEQATPKHRGEARRRGQVARSQEIFTAAVVVTGVTSLAWLGPVLGSQMLMYLRNALSGIQQAAVQIPLHDLMSNSALTMVVGAGATWLGAMLLAALIAGFAQVGFDFANEALAFKWDKLNPVANLQQLFSWSSLVRALTAVLKVGFLGVMCYGVIRETLRSDLLGRRVTPMELAEQLLNVILSLGWRVSLALGVIAAVDYVYQRWQFSRNIRMTKEEVKEESKQSEMSPTVRSRIRGLMRRGFRRRMLAEVPQATVIVTNPTHVAIALRYDRARMKCPQVVAKGLRLMAERIKATGREHGIPILENKPLARGLYRHCPVGAPIPASYYQAVAAVLVQVYRMAAKRESAATQKPPARPARAPLLSGQISNVRGLH